MFQDKNPTVPSVSPRIRHDDAVFMGWQKTVSGQVFALYNIIAAGHPFLGSTVTDQTLHKLNLQVPGAPLPLGPVKKF